ncbi:BLUF domain-containing protein [Lysobacter korlensis]|uniref:BLUF domain-containing protein n=1 Tax=Lysobacter korlensis TaxID=553636 RepID=A0ABV6RIC9_9GAMM
MLDAIVYTSRATEALTDTELELVLLRSRTLNAARGLTGALLKRGDTIVQYLEGEPEALGRTFARIAQSPLHQDVNTVARATGVDRHFTTWHMGFRDFQRHHLRDASTTEWIAAVPAIEDVEPGNAALVRLVELWHELGTSRSA